MKKKTGTREWADVNKNIFLGCGNDCLYCYAKADALRFGRIKSCDDWKYMKLLEDKLKETPRKVEGRIMFPSTHDIPSQEIQTIIQYLIPWLNQGNEILIVTKPRLKAMEELTKELLGWSDQVNFRFTIGSMDDDTLLFWEPGASDFTTRLQCLKFTSFLGYKTSVSCEPYLDSTIFQLVEEIESFVTDSIWIGKANMLKQRVSINTDKFRLVNKKELELRMKVVNLVQSDDAVRLIYKTFKDNPKVKWKESIKKVLGLPEDKVVG